MVIKKSRQKGFTLTELLVVVGIMAIILALAGGFSYKAAYRRSVDSVTTRVANTLQLTKLQAARNGVEYRTSFVQSGDELQLITERGDSNSDSTVWLSNQNSMISIDLDNSVVMSAMPSTCEFGPNGTASITPNTPPNNNIIILPVAGTDVDRCGQVIVSSLGRIATIQGHWDGSSCSQVGDD